MCKSIQILSSQMKHSIIKAAHLHDRSYKLVLDNVLCFLVRHIIYMTLMLCTMRCNFLFSDRFCLNFGASSEKNVISR